MLQPATTLLHCVKHATLVRVALGLLNHGIGKIVRGRRRRGLITLQFGYDRLNRDRASKFPASVNEISHKMFSDVYDTRVG